VFRVGSISKLFNAIAVMQQVEAGKLALDAPLPAEVLPLNPFPGAPAVTFETDSLPSQRFAARIHRWRIFR